MMDVARIVRGGVTIPAKVRRQLGLHEGSLVGLEITESAVIIRTRVRVVADDEADGASVSRRQMVPEGA